jgi:hypothetical protein
MKRLLLAGVGMVLLGAAGLILLHQVFDAPPRATAQAGAAAPPGGGLGLPDIGRQPGGAGAVNFKDLVPALLEALADTDGDVRMLAAATLLKIGPEAVPPLTEALKSKDRDTRANAAYLLGQLGDFAGSAVPALTKGLKDENTDVRRRVAYALHNIVSQSEGGAGLSGPDGIPGGGSAPVAATLARLAGGRSYTPGDPGLLLPAANPTAKPEKGR